MRFGAAHARDFGRHVVEAGIDRPLRADEHPGPLAAPPVVHHQRPRGHRLRLHAHAALDAPGAHAGLFDRDQHHAGGRRIAATRHLLAIASHEAAGRAGRRGLRGRLEEAEIGDRGVVHQRDPCRGRSPVMELRVRSAEPER